MTGESGGDGDGGEGDNRGLKPVSCPRQEPHGWNFNRRGNSILYRIRMYGCLILAYFPKGHLVFLVSSVA